jgi:hypothetical protein
MVVAVGAALWLLFSGYKPPSSSRSEEQPPPRWPPDYPPELRERALLQPVELLAPRADREERPDPGGARKARFGPPQAGELLYLPLWCRRLFGSGQFAPLPFELDLFAESETQPGRCTVLALDDDLRRRWFELEADLPQLVNDPFENPRGVFFGWQADGLGKAWAYFVSLDLRPAPERGAPHGQLVVGPAILDLRPPASAAARVVPLAAWEGKPPAIQALTEPVRTYRLRVQALPGKVRVQVNAERAIEFEPPFDPRGPVGVWVQEGGARFRQITVTALPSP